MRCSLYWFIVVLSLSGQARAQDGATEPAAEAVSAAEKGEAPHETNTPKFDILEFQIEGNTVLSTIDIERAVYPLLGEGKTIKDVENAKTALERAYQQAGYLTVSVDIPEQKVDAGVVSLRVTEGTVGRVRVTGSRYYSLGHIKARVPELAAGSTPNFPAVQKQLAQLSRSEDRRITPVLKPSRSPGKVDIELKVEDKLPFHADLELNNRYSANTKPLRLSGGFRYDNLWQREHSISMQYQTSPQKTNQVQTLSGTYVYPFSYSDKVLAFYGVRSRTDVAAVGAVNVVGSGDIVGLRAIVPLRAWEKFFHSLTFGLDYKRFGETVNLLGADSLNTPISYAPLTLQYSATVQDELGSMQYGVSTTLGVRRFLGTTDEEFANKRRTRDGVATANFFALKGEMARTHKLPSDWVLYGKLDGQLAGAPLISNEQYSIGGSDSVRGYLESEELGDDGLHGTIEVRTPSLAKWFPALDKALLNEFYALAFLDGGAVRVRQALPDQDAASQIVSAGLGLRLKAWKRFKLAVDFAHPFRDAAYTGSGDQRAHFSLGYEF
jgi:hemolysin activation/secretion protein